MTDHKILADTLVDAGIGRIHNGDYYALGRHGPHMHVNQFITDWRVAGRCLEDARFSLYEATEDTCDWLRDPKQIIETWYEQTQWLTKVECP